MSDSADSQILVNIRNEVQDLRATVERRRPRIFLPVFLAVFIALWCWGISSYYFWIWHLSQTLKGPVP